MMPNRCLACGDFILRESGLCHICWNSCTFIQDNCCITCGRLSCYQGLECGICFLESPQYNKSRALLNFDEFSNGLIYRLKYGDRYDVSAFFARMLLNRYSDFISVADVLLAVPMHPLKMIFRKYNQAHLLAKDLSKVSGKPYHPMVLKKSKLTLPQKSQDRKIRRKNLLGSFVVKQKDKIQGKNVLLIDDVLTTGSTANLCAEALKKAGAKTIYVLTAASVVSKR
ncbi:ComF family protein [Candidatus Sneabacter namystus]|uniref:ComF family protein n=1 Tax=Candidatus Sneabacter namystus TaxID=2601646 RepID=A0A5C0UHY7_9RICK|nr:ComF family protein [Candidatus Sneabacter namystus]QEK39377.1 ComF family protein [Candidatus Sneabacter namystus]